MDEENSFLGRGWSFPPSFDNSGGEIQMLTGEDDIQCSLQVLLSTKLGERVMQPLFGCNLDGMLFELLDTTLKTEMKNLIDNSKYSRIIQELKTRIRFWQDYYKDPIKE